MNLIKMAHIACLILCTNQIICMELILLSVLGECFSVPHLEPKIVIAPAVCYNLVSSHRTLRFLTLKLENILYYPNTR